MTPQDTLGTLVNADRVRSSIRRLFTGEISEIVGELLQNSQRARSSDVTITTNEAGFTYEDNGHGLLGGLAGFHTLLKIAESNFDNPTLEAQNPMGLGIHALLAHEQVATVHFASGDQRLTIDTGRWWADQAYYSTWFERLERLDAPLSGLRVEVECAPQLRAALQHTLLGRAMTDSPARGYVDLLRITLDGAAVETRLPAWATRGAIVIETTYQGCPLSIRYTDDGDIRSAVNWYGQLIKDSRTGNHFAYTLHVRAGRPVNPLSPSRRGLINDAAHAALITFIKEQLFAFLFNPANRAHIKPEWVSAYYAFDRERALREAPYFVAAPLGQSAIGSVQDLNGYGNPHIFTYDEPSPVLLDEPVVALAPTFTGDAQGQLAQGKPKFTAFSYGRDSFLPMIGEAYTLICGNTDRLKIGTIWWKPGVERADAFNLPGEWGIGDNDQEPRCWQPVTAATVFTFNDPACWDVDDVDFIVGTTDPLGFYRDEAWAGFDPENEDHDYDTIRDSYAESCAAYIRTLIGDAIPAKFDLWDIMAKMQDQQARISSIRYHYPPRSKGNRASPIAITARNSAGERKLLKLVA